MKTSRKNRHQNVIPYRYRSASPYPNAAESGYFLRRALDLVLAAATGLGAVSILMCILILG